MNTRDSSSVQKMNCKWIDNFHFAVIRLVTIQQRGQPGRLLFASVTLLLPSRMPPPAMRGVDPFPVSKKGENVFFRRVVLTAKEAIEWYRSLGSGEDKTPVPSNIQDINEKLDGINIIVPDLIDEPSWPQLGLPAGIGPYSEETYTLPFMGSSASRVHRRFGSSDGFDVFTNNDAALAFIERRAHIHLRDYDDYLGSVVLVVPDPVIYEIHNFFLHASEEAGERIFYHFIPRPGQTLEGIKLSTVDEQAGLLTDFETIELPSDGILDIEKGLCTGQYGFVVTHPDHGVLRYHPPLPFFRQMNFSMHSSTLDGTTMRVPIDDSPDSQIIEYSIAPHSSKGSSNTFGDEAPPNANARVARSAARRDNKKKAKQYGQYWFSNGTREEAMRFIHAEIRKAHSRLIIADPFFGGLQLEQFLYAVSGDVVKTMLLTSSQAFFSPKHESIERFEKRLEALKKHHKNVEVWVLRSDILHDRFLIIDDDVWFMGNSLNALGKKSSMIMKIPNPDEVIRELQKMQRDAQSLDDYKKNIPPLESRH